MIAPESSRDEISSDTDDRLAIDEPVNSLWRGTKMLVKGDIRRRLTLQGRRVTYCNAFAVVLMPGMFTVIAYRIANYLYLNGHRLLPLLLGDLAHLYARNEIHVGSRIGPGLVISDRPGVGIAAICRIGRNCTILGTVTMTGQSGGVDLSGIDLVVGDDCVIGIGTRIVGAISIANGTQIKPNAVVLRSSTIPGAILDGVPARRKTVVPPLELAGWNPLRPGQGMAA